MQSAGLFGFPRGRRIRDAAGYAAVKREGRRIRTGSFILYVAPASGPASRLGVIASRRVGNSVRRNRAKRVAREVFRLGAPAIPSPVDVVLIVTTDPEREPEFGSYDKDFKRAIRIYFQGVEPGRKGA
jgi:ribonuclease P protein component